VTPSVWAAPGVPLPAVARRVRELAAEDDEAIGAALGVSARTAKRLRHALGLLRAPSPHALVADATLRALHAEGLTTAAIAERSGLTYRTVQERLSRLGLRAHRAARVQRSATIPVRWTEAEVAAVRQAAEAAGVEVSEYVRGRVLG